MLARHRIVSSGLSSARRPGQVLAITAIMLVFLTSMVAFTIDTGHIAATRTELQRTADAAAHAAAHRLIGQSVFATAQADVRSEAKRFASFPGNGGLTLLDADIELGFYDGSRPSGGGRLSAASTSPFNANAVRVRVRKDAAANDPLRLFFAPVFGVGSAELRAEAVAVLQQATGFGAGSALIPFTVPENYYYKALDLPLRPEFDQPAPPDDAIRDTLRPNPDGTISNVADGVKEFLLYSSNRTTAGNYGSIDLGSASNGTPDLERQLIHGMNANDLNLLRTAMTQRATSTGNAAYNQVVTDGQLTLPQSLLPSSPPPAAAGPTAGVVFTGDPGISAGMKDEFSAIVGQMRVIPLHAGTASGTGNNAQYRVTQLVPVIVVASDFKGNPKEVWVQPVTGPIVDPKATGGGTDAAIPYLYTSPKLSVP